MVSNTPLLIPVHLAPSREVFTSFDESLIYFCYSDDCHGNDPKPVKKNVCLAPSLENVHCF